MNKDLTDILARIFFGLLFIAFGSDLILTGEFRLDVLPWWLPNPSLVVALCGYLLMLGGAMFLAGIWIQVISAVLGFYLAFSIAGIHIPGFIEIPVGVRIECEWLWLLMQKANLLRDLSLLGACIYFFNHELGKYSLETYLRERGIEMTPWNKPVTKEKDKSDAE